MRDLTDAELAKLIDKDIFHKISDAADKLGLDCYVVGGYVRDLFLERPSNDIDIVVVGSGISVANELKKTIGKRAHISVFHNFGTAQVKFGGMEVEFVGCIRDFMKYILVYQLCQFGISQVSHTVFNYLIMQSYTFLA